MKMEEGGETGMARLVSWAEEIRKDRKDTHCVFFFS